MMNVKYKVECTTRENGDTGPITQVGFRRLPNGKQAKLSTEDVIAGIKNNGLKFIVTNCEGYEEVDVIVEGDKGEEYLTTDPDKTKENNLLSLPIC